MPCDPFGTPSSMHERNSYTTGDDSVARKKADEAIKRIEKIEAALKDDKFAAVLCGIHRSMSKEDFEKMLDSIDWEQTGVTRGEVVAWIAEHAASEGR